MNMAAMNNLRNSISMNSLPSQQTFSQDFYKNNCSSMNFSQTFNPVCMNYPFIDQSSNQMSIQQSQFPNQQIVSSNSLYIPQSFQPHANSMKKQAKSQATPLLYPNKKTKLHPKSKFTPVEDQKLRELVAQYGDEDWDTISKMMMTRNQRQCRERWNNYLSPNVCVAPWTSEEDELLKKLHEEIGAKWVKISSYFPNRTDTNIKNRWMVLMRQKKAKENANKYNKEKEVKNTAEKDEKLNTPSCDEEKLKESDIIVNLEADSQIDFMESLSSFSSFNSDFMLDMYWI